MCYNFLMSNTKIWVISILGLIFGWVLISSASSLMPLLWALILAYFIHPLVILTQRLLRLKKKIFAVVIVLVFIAALFTAIISILLPLALNQLRVFSREFADYGMRVMEMVDQIQVYLDELGLDSRVSDQLDEMLRQFFGMVSNYVTSIVTTLLAYIYSLIDIVIIVIILFYFLLDGPSMVQYLINNTPKVLRQGVKNVFGGINGVVRKYIINMAVISLITGVACLLVYRALQMPFAVLLAVLAFVLNFIPYFGSIISGVVASLVALFYFDLRTALLAAFGILLINMLLGNILQPKLQADSLNMHPVVVIASVLACNHLWGAMGMFVAVPLLGVGRIVLAELMKVVNKY